MSGPEGREAPRGRAEDTAARLLRWYPKAWRSRYGEEFTELLTLALAVARHARAVAR